MKALYVDRMENGRIAKRVYMGECADSYSAGRSRKRWTDIVKGYYKKSFHITQASRMVYEWGM